MRQRLGLAAAMLGDPAVLVLDKPTNGLDPPGVRWFREYVRQLADEGRTVLLSSHALSEVELTADHVLDMPNRLRSPLPQDHKRRLTPAPRLHFSRGRSNHARCSSGSHSRELGGSKSSCSRSQPKKLCGTPESSRAPRTDPTSRDSPSRKQQRRGTVLRSWPGRAAPSRPIRQAASAMTANGWSMM